MIKELARLANHLDAKGLRKEADYLDGIIRLAQTAPTPPKPGGEPPKPGGKPPKPGGEPPKPGGDQGDKSTAWSEVKMALEYNLGGQIFAYGDGEHARRIYLFPDGLEKKAAHNAISPLGFKVSWRIDKGGTWDKLPSMRVSGALIAVDRVKKG